MTSMQTATARDLRVTIQPLINQIDLQASTSPLPCRGCTPDCPDYPQCEGKPWRLAAKLSGSLSARFGRR